ncbi:alpha/beta fold hydrolase [Clostridium uliginosum]|uniref:Platelet-activating factor acetylhydrolase, isoform II n=1 Tax=Clostridium uliginosum TaxID=119641 RepID=A0A1I1I9C5_9CLOT|nr:alpha/beta fold hydrolase [Clostridium uliginosum]SFC29860.1 Platelet-activating factor acetylhydrolase, isoform II [Clostridium uliginosum]
MATLESETKHSKKTNWTIRLLSISLILVLFSCIGASILQTGGGKVEIQSIKIPTESGKWITANIFKPTSATAGNKVPLVIIEHGLYNSKEMQDSGAIELSRRGIAVLAMDAYYHGDSSSSDSAVLDNKTECDQGMIPMVEFCYNNTSLDYIDKSKIGISGHSMGGFATWMTMHHYGTLVSKALEDAKGNDTDGGTTITEAERVHALSLNKVAAALPMGFLGQKEFNMGMMKDTYINFGVLSGYYDENAWSFEAGKGDLTNTAESLAIVNSVLPKDNQVSAIEVGKQYGDASKGTLRMMFNPKEIHGFNTFSTSTAGDIVTFFTNAFQINNPIPVSNQVWLWKEIFNFIGMIGVFLFIFPLTQLLLKVPVFESLKHPEPKALPALANGKSKLIFWGSILISTAISTIAFLPIGNLDKILMPDPAKFAPSKAFPLNAENFIMIWACFTGLIIIALFIINYKIHGKKNGISSEMWGLKTNVKEVLKYLLLAVTSVFFVYQLVIAANYIFHTDFRLWNIAFKTFSSTKLWVALQYMPLFFVFYFASSLTINGSYRIEGKKEWKNILLCAVVTALPVIIMTALQYGYVFATGVTLFRGEGGSSWLRVFVGMNLIPLLLVSAPISRYLFKVTGKVYLGAMVNTILLVLMTAANTANFLPLR